MPELKRPMHNEGEEVDGINTLPNCILIYIMKFLTTKEAVQTCILSKRWKDLWKYLPTLIANSDHFERDEILNRFVHKVLQNRYDYSALQNIAIKHHNYVHSQDWDKIIDYAVSHEVEQFKVDTCFHDDSNMKLFHPMFFLHSLKCLDLSLRKSKWIVKLPQILDLPELVKCRLRHVEITSNDDNDYAEPFLRCKKLSTLVIESCTLSDSKILCVFNHTLASLTIQFSVAFKVKISAPNLKGFTFLGYLTSSKNNQIFEHNLKLIEEASVNVLCNLSYSEVVETLKNWFKSIRNVPSSTIHWQILEDLPSMPNFPGIKPICFGNLMSFFVRLGPDEVPLPQCLLIYLDQDSPHIQVRIIEESVHRFGRGKREECKSELTPLLLKSWLLRRVWANLEAFEV